MSKTRILSIGTALIAVSALQLAASCSSDPDRPKTPRSTADSKTGAAGEAAQSAPAGKMVFEGPGTKLVEKVGDWKIADPPRYFGPKNLWDLINGGAEIYVEFGFVKMVTVDYRTSGRPTQTVTVEVYDMGSPNGAFGRTARFLEGLTDPSRAGQGLPPGLAERGILGDGDLVVWKDRYLIHATLLEENPAADPATIARVGKEVLPGFAEAVSARIEGQDELPEIFDRFPAEGRIGRSEAWFPGDVLGIAGLGSGYAVRYASGDVSWTAFTTERFASAQAAEAAWKSVKSAGAEGRRVAIKLAGERVVGLVQEGEPGLADDAAEKFAATLEQGFANR